MASEPLANRPLLQRNLQRTFHNLLAVGRVFGVVPWDIEPFASVPVPATLCRLRKFLLAANVVYVLLIIVGVCAGTLMHQAVPAFSDFFAIRTLYLAEDVVVNIIILLVVGGCWRLRSFYPTFGNELLSTGDRLYGCGSTINFQQVESTIQRLMIGSSLYYTALVMLDLLFNSDISCKFYCRTLVYTLPNSIHVFALHQYVGMHLIVCYYFRTINNVLTTHRDDNRKKAPGRQADLLETIRKVHLKLDYLTVQVNDCFGPLIVCTVLSSFVVLTLQMFHLYKVTSATSTTRSWNSNDSIKVAYTMLRIGVHSAKVLLILYPIHQGQCERNRTGTVLYRFANHQESNGPTHDTLMLFAGQLLHGKGHYKACGLITLDLTLISKIVAALTTYLVILIQFDSAAKVQMKEACARYFRLIPPGMQSECKQ